MGITKLDLVNMFGEPGIEVIESYIRENYLSSMKRNIEIERTEDYSILMRMDEKGMFSGFIVAYGYDAMKDDWRMEIGRAHV